MFRPILKVTPRASPPVYSISSCFPPLKTRTTRAAARPYHAFHDSTSKHIGLILIHPDVCRRKQIWHVQRGIVPFHSSRPAQAFPLIPMLLGALKASSSERFIMESPKLLLAGFKYNWGSAYYRPHCAHVPSPYLCQKSLVCEISQTPRQTPSWWTNQWRKEGRASQKYTCTDSSL